MRLSSRVLRVASLPAVIADAGGQGTVTITQHDHNVPFFLDARDARLHGRGAKSAMGRTAYLSRFASSAAATMVQGRSIGDA